jgi:hypothetical protein
MPCYSGWKFSPSFVNHISQFQSGCAIIAGVVIFDQSRAVAAVATNKIILWRKSQSGGGNTIDSRQ